MASVSVLLPTLDEEASIVQTIESIRKALPGAEPVVVDGLSKDRTVQMAEASGARVLMERRRGKGFAVKRAFDEIASDFLLMVDVDLTYPVEAMPLFLDALKESDIVMGSRFKGTMEPGAMSPVNALGNRILTLSAGLLFSRPVSDVCTGMWGFRRSAYKALEIGAGGFEVESALFAQAAKKNLSIAEIPIHYRRREGRSKVRIWDGFRIMGNLLRERMSP